ncbi:HD domain-containing phosphohydrolase [Photobacterium atrarenae]|uniref:HD domain-containing protein n=1 Tax=Photobacterium atrarenae TaxID=865757 RepID=A0ABY5GPY8_9GAMM|nr:HD domain-containing phosphohydrolase [Photobacterium atrarenae]UTV30582.1 HD domain-containing protein [Photobacterium atrarenae]
MLRETVRQLHRELIETGLEGLHRISIALVDEAYLRTYVDSTEGIQPLKHHSIPLEKSPSLSALVRQKKTRIVDDYSSYLRQCRGKASAWLRESQLHSSYTIPIFFQNNFLGFIFFNSCNKAFFNPLTVATLDDTVKSLRESIIHERTLFDNIVSLSKFSEKASEIRDECTAMHCGRLTTLTRIIARHVVQHCPVTDREVYYLIKFSPLHDIGKIGVADDILLKPGRLTAEEFREMKRHVEYGMTMVDAACDGVVKQHEAYRIIRTLISEHHEMLDGSGYPEGLKGEEISLFSRIVTVSDIFDALTSDRPYKKAWTLEQALTELQAMADHGKLDPLCVEALQQYFDQPDAQQRFTLFREEARMCA